MSSVCRPKFWVMAVTNIVQPMTSLRSGNRVSGLLEIPTRHGDTCVCGNGIINRHTKFAEVGVQHEVVNEIAVSIVYLKLVSLRDRKRAIKYTDRRFHQVSA